jgi:hypothetical protein
MQHRHGTRFEFVLASSEGAARAIYQAVVERPETEPCAATVEVTPTGATLVAGGEGLDAAAAHQLLALAKTLGKRAEDAPWPRRITRWRQPGVR